MAQFLTQPEIDCIKLTLRLAACTTVASLAIGAPLAWWLSRKDTLPRRVITALTTMPMVMPPTVLGFYLLYFMGPFGPIGQLFDHLGLKRLPFTFTGLVVASVLCSMPFVVQPLVNAFEALGARPLEAASTLGASTLDAFFTVIAPQAKPAFLTAAIMSFSHAIGEFGVVLMIGGNIPKVTRVLSMQIYLYVENSQYGRAHVLAGGMMLFALLTIMSMQILNPRKPRSAPGQN
jgi:molybdate transport system permease protein